MNNDIPVRNSLGFSTEPVKKLFDMQIIMAAKETNIIAITCRFLVVLSTTIFALQWGHIRSFLNIEGWIFDVKSFPLNDLLQFGQLCFILYPNV